MEYIINDIRMGHSRLPTSQSLPSKSAANLNCQRLHSPDQFGARVVETTQHDQSQMSHHKPSLTNATIGQHTRTYDLSSTSNKPPHHRLRRLSHKDLSKSPLLPRFCLNIHSMLLYSCLLFIFCNSVPFVSCQLPPSTGIRPMDPASSISAFGGQSSYNNRRSNEPVETERDSNLFGPLISIDSNSHPNEMKCLYYNRTQCEKHKIGCGETYQVCHPLDGNDRTSLCYALWRNTTETGVTIEFKGCWLGLSKDCVSKESNENGVESKCVQTQSPNRNRKSLFFCCCSGEMCNKEVRHVPPPLEPVTSAPNTAVLSEGSLGHTYRFPNIYTFYLLLGLGIFFIIGMVSVIVFVFGKCRHKPNSADVPTSEPLLDGCNQGTSGYIGLNPVQLKEIRAQGKFGSVWLATDGRDNMVAVKVFNLQDRSSWQIEKDVYSLPQMKHNNVLSYLGAERRGEGLDVDYWLITEYHPNGSLWDYLKSHTVNLKQLLTIIQGIGRGLTHLHEELPASPTEGPKPSIAHRDFKSKNVLLGSNFRACIADFGLAIVFHPNSTIGDAHGQVGTRRYMAPEVLEGAINFNRDSFLRIDMYACGLVLWELMSRCCSGDITCAEYRLPFEEEVGTHPTLEDMQEVVSQQKKRPKLPDAWFKHPAMTIVANTVQDCWDQDAEARISASTICERIQSLILNEDNCLSLNNHTNTASYRVPFAANATPNANSNANSKNTFLMTAQANPGPIASTNSASPNGNAFNSILRETST